MDQKALESDLESSSSSTTYKLSDLGQDAYLS